MNDAVLLRLRSRVALAALVLGAVLALPAGAFAQGAAADSARAAGAAPPAAVPDSGVARAGTQMLNRPMTVGSKQVKLIGQGNNVVRTGPGNEFAIAGVYPEGMTFHVIAKSGEWYNIRLSESETGWVHSSLCRELDDLSGLEFRPNPKLYTRTGSIVLGAYAGAYAFDRKANSLVVGGRLSYYVFDRFLAEAGVSWTHVDRAPEIVESLFGLSLEAENFQMLFYQMNVTWEVLPGRQMVPYLSGGVGSALMLGRAEVAVNAGAGVRMFISKRNAIRWEVRDYRFKSGSDSARLTNNNIEFTLGTEHLF